MAESSFKTVLITGGAGGIGKEIAVGLAKLGWTTVVTSREKSRGEAAVTEITNRTGNHSVGVMLADLSSKQQIQNLAAEFTARHNRLDVLVNNVGGLYGRRWETADGVEYTLALNHLGPFLLTHLLLPLLEKSTPSRIVNVNSEGHRAAQTVDFDAFGPARWKRGFRIYSQTKLANLLFTYELARRLAHSGITVNAVHPGIVYTQLFRRFIAERFGLLGGFVSKSTAWIARKVAYRITKFDSVEAAAAAPIYLASSAEVAGVTGKYFDSNKKIVRSSPPSYDETLSRRVWEVSAGMTGLASIAAQAMIAAASPMSKISWEGRA